MFAVKAINVDQTVQSESSSSIKSSGRESEIISLDESLRIRRVKWRKEMKDAAQGTFEEKATQREWAKQHNRGKWQKKKFINGFLQKKKKKRWTVENRALNLEWTNSVLFILHFGITKLKSVTGSKTLTLNKCFNAKQYYETKLEGSLHSDLKWSSKGCWLVLGPLGGRQLFFWQS